MPTNNTERQKVLSQASGQADKRLKEAHSDEWNKYMIEEAERRGQTWAPRKTEEEREEERLREILSKRPDLSNKIKEEVLASTKETPDSEGTP